MITKEGKCIQFHESDVRSMGRASMGVRGIKLKPEDEVIQMDVVRDEGADLLTITENGLGKRSPLSSYRYQTRGGSGVKTANLTKKTGKVIGARTLEKGIEGDLVLVSKAGQIIRLAIESIPTRGRATQGVYLMRTKAKDTVASISLIRKEPEIEEKPEETKENPIPSEQTTLV